MCQDLMRLSEIEASVVIGRGHDSLVERTNGGFTAPCWAVDLARAEIRSWSTGELVNWDRAWECALEDSYRPACATCLPLVA